MFGGHLALYGGPLRAVSLENRNKFRLVHLDGLLPKVLLVIMPYMQPTRSSQLQWSTKGLLGILRATRGAPAPRPVRTAEDPPEPLSAEELSEVAKNWRSRSEEEEGRADTVAQALESLAEHRRAAASRSRARIVGQRISEFMRI